MPSLIHGCAAGRKAIVGLALALLTCTAPGHAQRKFSVPTQPPADGSAISFRDGRYGVRFQVPPGWDFARRDREFSTFRLDARTAPPASEMRAVASLGFNPFPRSTLSGALVYFSVAKHSNDRACAAEVPRETPEADAPAEPLSIGGMPFLHGHDEHGGICVEARDEVYTAYRKGSCYRFDLTVNTFCAATSGAAELNAEQMHSIEAQMAGILSTVALDWEKTGPQPVPVPETPAAAPGKAPRHQIPAAPALPRSTVAIGQ